LKAGLVGLIVRHVLNGGGTAGTLPYSPRQFFDGDFLGIADVDDFSDGAVQVHEANEGFDSVADIAEAARLLSAAVDADGGVVEGGLDEIGEHHAVAASLPRAHGIEQTSDDDRQLFLFPTGRSKNSMESIRRRAVPAAFGGWSKEKAGVFEGRNVGRFDV